MYAAEDGVVGCRDQWVDDRAGGCLDREARAEAQALFAASELTLRAATWETPATSPAAALEPSPASPARGNGRSRREDRPRAIAPNRRAAARSGNTRALQYKRQLATSRRLPLQALECGQRSSVPDLCTGGLHGSRTSPNSTGDLMLVAASGNVTVTVSRRLARQLSRRVSSRSVDAFECQSTYQSSAPNVCTVGLHATSARKRANSTSELDNYR